MSGKRFGRVVVVARAGSRGPHSLWSCVCDCGRLTYVTGTHLRSGHTTSCGCARADAYRTRNAEMATHGMTNTPEFGAWSQMKKRCLNPAHKSYPSYGGRGITVCEEWRDDFAAFFAHIGPRPSASHSLDRIRNDDGYMPGNVRWATRSVQMSNRRVSVTAVIDGETMSAAQIAARYGLDPAAVLWRIHKGWSAERLITPSRGMREAR